MNRKNVIISILIIIILGIIGVLLFINGSKNDDKLMKCNNFIDDINNASVKYINDNRENLNSYKINDYKYRIYADLLILNDYLNYPIINPFTNDEINEENIIIDILLNKDYSVRKINIVNDNDLLVDCNDESTFSFKKVYDRNDMLDEDVSLENDNGEENNITDENINNNENNNDNKDNNVIVKPEVDNNSGIITDNKIHGNINNKKEIKYVNKFPKDAYCAQAIDEFYSKNGVTYYFTCKMSQYIYVVVNGVEYGLVEALEKNIVTIEEVEAARGSKFASKSNNLYSY